MIGKKYDSLSDTESQTYKYFANDRGKFRLTIIDPPSITDPQVAS